MTTQPKKIDLDSDNPSLKDVLAEASKWAAQPAARLSPQQHAIVHLNNLIGSGSKSVVRAGEDCFICIKGA